MTTAIQKAEPAALSPRMGRAIIMAEALQQESDQRELLGKYIRAHMVEGTDYGVVPGTTNKTLLKPGAEKLTQLYRCIPRFTIEEKIENWETHLFYYRFSCQVVTQADDAIVAEGVGSCSTYESRYRWRSAGRKCPACGQESIIKGKAEYGGGYLCFAKKGGCGVKFADGDPEITGQTVGRVQNPDLLDQVNTVLKMAKKRALVDAAIALARCSDIFTQDLDDLVHADRAEDAPRRDGEPFKTPEQVSAELGAGYESEVVATTELDALRAVVDRMNADVKAKRLNKAATDVLMPLVAKQKAKLTPAAPPVQAPAPPAATTPAAPAEPATFPLTDKGAALPSHGPDFAAWVAETDADFADRGLCQPGSVQARLMEVGAKVGLTSDWERWNKTAVETAVHRVSEFEAALTRAEVVAAKDELHRTRKKWSQCVEWLNARFEEDYTPQTKLWDVLPAHLAALAADLKTHPTGEKAGATA